MVWTALLGAGVQAGSMLMNAAQRNRARSQRTQGGGQARSDFAGVYEPAAEKGAQAARDAALHQGMTMAGGSGTMGGQAAAVQAAQQRAPMAAAQAQLAGARIGEGAAAGAQRQLGVNTQAFDVTNTAQTQGENQLADSLGMGAQLLSSAFGGGIMSDAHSKAKVKRLEAEVAKRDMFIHEATGGDTNRYSAWEQAFLEPKYDPNAGVQIQFGQAQMEDPDVQAPPSGLGYDTDPTPAPAPQRVARHYDADAGAWVVDADQINAQTREEGAHAYRSDLAPQDPRHKFGLARDPAFGQREQLQWNNMLDEGAGGGGLQGQVHPAQGAPQPAARPQQAGGGVNEATLAKIRRDSLTGLGADPNTPYASPLERANARLDALRGDNMVAQANFGSTINPTMMDEGAHASVQENQRFDESQFTVPDVPEVAAHMGQAQPQLPQPRTPQPLPGGTNRPSGTLRHHSPHSGVSAQYWSADERADFAAKNPDFSYDPRSNSFMRQGDPSMGTGGMGGPGASGPPDSAFIDPSGKFEGDFVPQVTGPEGRRMASEIEERGIRNPVPATLPENAMSNRLSSTGGFQRGQGYTSTFDVPDSYRQMIKDGKISGMVQVPILDFRRRVGLQRPEGGGQRSSAGMADGGLLPSPYGEPDAPPAPNMDSTMAEAQDILDTANAAEASRRRPQKKQRRALAGRGPRVIEEQSFRRGVRDDSPVWLGGSKTVESTPFVPGKVDDSPAWREPEDVNINMEPAQVERPEDKVSIDFGQAKMEPAVDLKFETAQMSPESDAVPYSRGEMENYVRERFFKGQKNLSKQQQARLKKKTDEFMRKQTQELSVAYLDEPPRSDKRSKKKVKRGPAAEVFQKTPGYSYEYKDPGAPGAVPGTQVGIMAQDLEKTPAGSTLVHTGPDGMKRVDTQRLPLLQSAALKEAFDRIDKLEAGRGR